MDNSFSNLFIWGKKARSSNNLKTRRKSNNSLKKANMKKKFLTKKSKKLQPKRSLVSTNYSIYPQDLHRLLKKLYFSINAIEKTVPAFGHDVPSR